MTKLLEDPLPILLFGIVAEAILGVILLQTRRGVVLLAMAAVLLVVLVGVGLEWLVVTEVEQVEAVLEDTAADLVAGDEQQACLHISESNAHSRQRVAWALRVADITRIKINDLDIKINRLTSPRTAKATLIGVISATGKGRAADFGHGSPPIHFTVSFEQQNGRWLITQHEEGDFARP